MPESPGLVAWIAVLGGPAASFEDLRTALTHREFLLGAICQIPFLLLLSAQAVLGYVIWAKWFLIASGKDATSRRYWSLASLHHFGWVLVAGCLNWRLTVPLSLAMFWYSVAVLVCCCVAVFLAGGGKASADSPGGKRHPTGISPV